MLQKTMQSTFSGKRLIRLIWEGFMGFFVQTYPSSIPAEPLGIVGRDICILLTLRIKLHPPFTEKRARRCGAPRCEYIFENAFARIGGLWD